MDTDARAISDAEHRAIDLAIHIQPDTFQDALIEFVKTSSLAYCTELDSRGDDSIAVVPSWDPETFSTGEKALWALLKSLTGGDIHTLADRGSIGNRIAFVAAVRALMGVGQ